MAQQLIFFNKSYCDYDNAAVVATASEGSATVTNVFDRSNTSIWGTTGSVDSNNTTFQIDLGDIYTVDSILLLKHNFKNFLLQYKDPVSSLWVNFPTPINVSGNTASSNYFTFALTLMQVLKLTITGTQVANSDKFLAQFIVASKIGQLAGWPVLSGTTIGKNLQEQTLLSGKRNIIQNIGFFGQSFAVSNWKSAADLAILETLHSQITGFLYWPCGGDTAQFSSVRQGYRMEDIFLTRCRSEFNPDWAHGLYVTGMNIKVDLIEVVY